MTIAIILSFKKSLESNAISLPVEAPKTFRILISFILCWKAYAIRPNNPMQAIKIAKNLVATYTLIVRSSALYSKEKNIGNSYFFAGR